MNILKNEITILNYLDHKNIVKFVEVKKTKKNFFLIFEYCNGGTLSNSLAKYMEKNGKPFPEEIVQHLMRQIIDAFQHLENKRLVHRLLNLDNILLNYEDEEDLNNLNLMKAQVKISDFGITVLNDYEYDDNDLFFINTVYSDPFYPTKNEPLSNSQKIKGKSDIWSIGVICYEMLIGKPPFDAKDKEEFLKNVEKGNVSLPSTLSLEVISFIKAMLQPNANYRLNASPLMRHDFLAKDISKFYKKESPKETEYKFNININKYTTVWPTKLNEI